MEAALRLTQFCFDSAALGIYHVQSEGRFLNVNAHAAAMLGYTVEELSGLSIWDIDPNAETESFAESWQQLVDTGFAFSETMHIRKDGSRIPVEIISNLLEYDGRKFSICFVQDISERKRMEQALKESEKRLDLALSGANEGIWDWDIIEDTIFLDHRYYAMAGYQPNEFPSTYDEILKRIHKDDVEQVRATNKEYMAGELHNFEPEFRFQRKDGSYMWIQAKGTLTREAGGNPIRFSGTQTDITRRKHAEIEKERLLKELQKALENVKTLSGLLPICSACKKIRDDKGYWNQLESYIHDHSEAEFSHSLCPECAKNLYPDLIELQD
jgi:PAS domain S-box-containing protein